jgi:two-component system chemotaxis sensor kinase CheA
MKIDLSQFRETFLMESAEHVATMESGLLALRTAPEDAETLNAVFRSAHSIKGGAGSFGFESLTRFTHAMENLLERLRSMELPVTDGVIRTLLESLDVLRVLLQAGANGALPEDAQHLLEEIEALAGAAPAEAKEPAANASPAETEGEAHAAGMKMFRIEFHPDRELFSSGTNPIVLLRNLAKLGKVSVSHLHAEGVPALGELDPAQCYLAWTIELATDHEVEELREIFEFVEHLAEIRISNAEAPPPVTAPESESAAEKDSASAAAPAGESPFVERRGTQVADRRQSGVGDRRQSAVGDRRQPGMKSAAGGESSSIRVATEKVDRLIDLVGELVIAHVMTAQMVERFTPECLPKLREAVAAMERNTRELHERVMAVRMLPVGTLFHRYQRTVFDIAQAAGKQIELVLSGEETEIDKSMLELLGDPLTHLVRNAADHGIELPEARLAAGKPAQGTINLRAFHRAGRVVIEVGDDGAGIDPERIRAKAVERGLIAENAQMSDEQLRMLIFEPGFSTRDQISDLSGRGVGMDVVKQNVQRLNGTVSVASQAGAGSTVSIELPLTLAILEGLLVRVADRTLVLPLLSVVETVSPRAGQIQRVAEQGEVIIIRDLPIPLLRLHRFLGLTPQHGVEHKQPESGPRRLVVVVETGRRQVGMMVDELLGQQQVVVKSLERNLRKVDGVMGATILADGCVAPIIDVAGISALNLFSLDEAGRLLPETKPPAEAARAAHMTAMERGGSAHALV